MEVLYFDHAATSPMHPDVIKVMTTVMQENFGNASSIHRLGRKSHELLEDAREVVANSLQVKPHEIIFNSGATEADNTAIISTALARQHLGKHIITTIIEHPAVIEPLKYLETLGFDVTYLPIDKTGQISLTDFKKALREDTILVSVMYVNNEIGTLLPIAEIGELLKDHQAVFHTDAVQGYGNQVIHPYELGIDLLSVSAHKINGPKGVGFLFKSDGVNLPEFIRGGEQEEKRRAGTENLAGICGLAKAVEILTPAEKASRNEAYRGFTKQILDALAATDIRYEINGTTPQKSPHVLNLHFPGVINDLLLMKLDLAGVAISTGSACTAGNVEPSRILTALYGENHPAVKESLRVSFGLGNTAAQVATFADKLIVAVKSLQK